MSGFFNNRFVSRRGFLGRTLAGAATAGALGALAADKSKETNPFAYDVSRFVATDPKLIRYEQKRVLDRLGVPDDQQDQIFSGNFDRLFPLG